MEEKIASGIMLTFLLTSMLTLAFCIQMVKAEPITIIVPDDYSTIQEAINAANPEDTIYVRAGTYYGRVVVNKIVSLIGESREKTIIDGGGAGDVVSVAANNVVVNEFTIRNSYDGGSGIVVSGINTTIQNNNITNNGVGISLYTSSNNRISGNNITNNDKGIQFYYSSNNSIAGNNITNSGTGISLTSSSSSNSISQNNIRNNSVGIIFLDSSSNNSMFGNDVTTNREFGIYLSHSSNNVLKSNVLSNNAYGFFVSGSSLSEFVQNMDLSNMVNSKPVCYWINEAGKAVPANAGYVALINCTGITVKDLNLTNNGQGILLVFTTNSTVMKNNITNNHEGIGAQLFFEQHHS